MKFVNLGLMFVLCSVLVACGKAEADKSEIAKANEWADKNMSYKLTGQTPCQVANTCKTMGQILDEQAAMRKGAK